MEIETSDFLLVSCPSKVLLIGGYAVLTEKNRGLTLGLSPRFYATQARKESNRSLIEVNSPQIGGNWKYEIEGGQLKQVLNTMGEGGIGHQLISDSEFYSIQNRSQTGKHFVFFEKENLRKTGLGSSSCVIVVAVASLLFRYAVLNKDTFQTYLQEKTEGSLMEMGMLHTLCQLANSFAQNKIGSGFDIATCLFGSQLFERFPESILHGALKGEKRALSEIFEKVDPNFSWDITKAVSFSKKISILMLDFTTGSDTRVLVGKVRQYLQENKEKERQFLTDTADCLQSFMECERNYPHSHQDFRTLSEKYRKVMKNLGNLTGADIEPDLITVILDVLFRNIPEVIYCISPGAGGYDAASILYPTDWDPEMLIKEIKNFESLSNQQFCELWDMSKEKLQSAKREDTIKLLMNTKINYFKVNASDYGIRVEKEESRIREIKEILKIK